jgi:hypothetical protein
VNTPTNQITEPHHQNITAFDRALSGAISAAFMSATFLAGKSFQETNTFKNLWTSDNHLAKAGAVGGWMAAAGAGGLLSAGAYKIVKHFSPEFGEKMTAAAPQSYNSYLSFSPILYAMAIEDESMNKWAVAGAGIALGALEGIISSNIMHGNQTHKEEREKPSFQERVGQQRQERAASTQYERV